jgi:hypothetical protein
LFGVQGETIMRGFLQAVCVFAIALGAGMFATGNYLEPRIDPSNVADFSRFLVLQSDERIASSVLRGCGIGLMTLGVLGLVVPLINALVFRHHRPEVLAQQDGGQLSSFAKEIEEKKDHVYSRSIKE